MNVRDEKYLTVLWWESLKKRNHSEDLGVDGKIIFKWFIEEYAGCAWTGFIRLRTVKDGELLWTRKFRIRRGLPGLAERTFGFPGSTVLHGSR
jgi:hypothetical protein